MSKKEFEAAKCRTSGNRWGVFSKTACCYVHIGGGKKFCEKKAEELNSGN